MQLTEHPVFEGLDLDRLQPSLESWRQTVVEEGDLLSGPGLRHERLHLLLEGELAAFELTADGKRVLMEIVEPGGLDGLLLMAGLEGHFTEAKKPSLVVALTRQELEKVVELEPRFARNLLRLVLRRLEKREQQIHSLAHREPSRRLARQLLALGEYVGSRQGDVVVLRPRLSHQMLADMLALRRETVTLSLGALSALGAVQVRRSAIAFNVKRLEAIVEGYAPAPPSQRRSARPRPLC
jgi:CRP-like cAMP-binding protein